VRARDFGALLLLAAIWGSSYLYIRVAVEPLGPLVLSFMRVAIGAAGLLAFASYRGRLGEIRPLNRVFVVLSLLNTAVPYALIAFSELHLSASMAGILNATTPLFTALAVAGWERERIQSKVVAGLLLGFAGVTVLVGWNPAPLDEWLVLAVLAMLAASASYGLANVYAKRSLRGVSALGAATGQQLGGGAWLFPFAAATVAAGGSDTSPSIRVVLALLALGLVCTSIAYLLYFHLIASAGAVNTSSVGFLIPIFGILWSAIFLDEAVRPSMLIGLGLILASVVLVTGVRLPQHMMKPLRRTVPVATAADELIQPGD
jgi:drug/metabolite transporter (DMT)-like permease